MGMIISPLLLFWIGSTLMLLAVLWWAYCGVSSERAAQANAMNGETDQTAEGLHRIKKHYHHYIGLSIPSITICIDVIETLNVFIVTVCTVVWLPQRWAKIVAAPIFLLLYTLASSLLVRRILDRLYIKGVPMYLYRRIIWRCDISRLVWVNLIPWDLFANGYSGSWDSAYANATVLFLAGTVLVPQPISKAALPFLAFFHTINQSLTLIAILFGWITRQDMAFLTALDLILRPFLFLSRGIDEPDDICRALKNPTATNFRFCTDIVHVGGLLFGRNSMDKLPTQWIETYCAPPIFPTTTNLRSKTVRIHVQHAPSIVRSNA